MPYVDGFLLAVPRRKLPLYRSISRRAGRIWKELGALEYRECVGDDVKTKVGRSFPKIAGARAGEVVVFSWIVYSSKAARNRINGKIMQDPRIAKMMTDAMPFDPRRMAMAGFKVFVDL
jgi:uncharacterized protein YbaA (DUF1428 family)